MTVRLYALSDAELARRTSVLSQFTASRGAADQGPRPAPWGLNREPFNFRELTEFGWVRKKDLELGEELGQQGAADALAAIVQPRGISTRGGPARCPEQRSFALTIDTSVAIAAVTSPAIPWPFEIVGASLIDSLTTTDTNQWNLFLVDAPITGAITTQPGTPMIEISSVSNGTGTLEDGTINWGVPFRTDVTRHETHSHATALIGASVLDSGKRICFAVKKRLGAARIACSLLVTVRERLCQESAAASATVRVVTTAAPAAGVTPTPTPAAPKPTPARAITTAPAPTARAPTSGHQAHANAYPIDDPFYPAARGVYRWAVPDLPGRTFATESEANVAWAAAQVSALPPAQRAAAIGEVQRRAGELIYGTREIATPINILIPSARHAYRG